MRLRVIAVGTRMPAWVTAGVAEYLRRLPRQFAVTIEEVKPAARHAGDAAAIADEGQRVLRRAAGATHLIALDERGLNWSTTELAHRLGLWRDSAADIALLVGGADGHAPQVRAAVHELWSLSALTLPHALVRVILAEQLYRAHTLLSGHPYHRS